MNPSIRDCMRLVCWRTGISEADLCGPSRERSIAYPRQMAMWFARRATTRSFPQIGMAFGGRDHTTVMHAIRAAEARIAMSHEDAAFAAWLMAHAAGGIGEEDMPTPTPARRPQERAPRAVYDLLGDLLHRVKALEAAAARPAHRDMAGNGDGI